MILLIAAIQAAAPTVAQASWMASALDAGVKYLAVAALSSLVTNWTTSRKLAKKISDNDTAVRELIKTMDQRQTKLEQEIHGHRGVQETLNEIRDMQQEDHDRLLSLSSSMEAFTTAVSSFGKLLATHIKGTPHG